MIIATRSQLRRIIKYERKRYNLRPIDKLTGAPKVRISQYVKLLRLCEYYKPRKGCINSVLFIINRIRKNRLGTRLGIEIGEVSCGEGLLIYHSGSIVINGASTIGKNCRLHGGNCIGNSGNDKACPVIGDNAELGYNAVVIGKVKLGDNIKIGANAVVVKDHIDNGVTLIGIPARPARNQIKREEIDE